MAFLLYDTLTRSVKELKPSDGKRFRFYCCGPTVYGPAHIGNFRTFLLQDVFRRVLEMEGLEPLHVRNLTDVDDKTIRESQAQGQTLDVFTAHWTEQFHRDCKKLNVLSPHVEPKATEHIALQVELIAKLVERRHAYVAEDGSVYFAIQSFPSYGCLSRVKDRELQVGEKKKAETHSSDEYEADSMADFALWKAHKPEDGPNAWDSPWGKGRPGWHIECSAMGLRYLDNTMDLHSGGIDLTFPHHENEIAQSEACTGETFANHWFHISHLMVENRKMSKSLGNLYTLADIEAKGYLVVEMRYVLISGKYRQPLNFTWDSLNAARSALGRLAKVRKQLLEKAGKTSEEKRPSPVFGPFQKAWEALLDDLETPEALGQIFSALKALDLSKLSEEQALEALKGMDAILYALGLDLSGIGEAAELEIPDEIRAWADQRAEARLAKDWAKADEFRALLDTKGWIVKDAKDGYELKPKN